MLVFASFAGLQSWQCGLLGAEAKVRVRLDRPPRPLSFVVSSPSSSNFFLHVVSHFIIIIIIIFIS